MSRASFVALTLYREEEEEVISSNLSGADPNDSNDDDQSDNSLHSNPPQNSSSSAAVNFTTAITNTNPRGGRRCVDIVNRWLTQYVNWLDTSPLAARCTTCAVTAILGAVLTARHRQDEKTWKKRRSSKSQTVAIDWLEVLAFGLHGGLVAGPMSYYIDSFLEENFDDSQSAMVLFDQVVTTPVQLFVMFCCLDTTKAALRAFPASMTKSWSLLGSAVSESWATWPISIYLLLKVLKKRKHYVAAINLCSIAWVAHLAKKRTGLGGPPPPKVA